MYDTIDILFALYLRRVCRQFTALDLVGLVLKLRILCGAKESWENICNIKMLVTHWQRQRFAIILQVAEIIDDWLDWSCCSHSQLFTGVEVHLVMGHPEGRLSSSSWFVEILKATAMTIRLCNWLSSHVTIRDSMLGGRRDDNWILRDADSRKHL